MPQQFFFIYVGQLVSLRIVDNDKQVKKYFTHGKRVMQK